MREKPIAVFDSGVGGIAVLRALRACLPHEHLLYFGDNANAPYGERSTEQVRALVTAHAAALLPRAKALVLACNTATAVAANVLRERFADAIIVGMEPALRPALAVARAPRVLVLATEVTLREEKFARLLEKHAKTATVLPLPAPGIVRLVEKGEENGAAMRRYLCELLSPVMHPPPDAVVLGCTHFCFARAAISELVPRRVPIFDGVEGTVAEVSRRLAEKGLLREGEEKGSVRLCSSDVHALPLMERLLWGR